MKKIRKYVNFRNTDDFIKQKRDHCVLEIYESAQVKRPLITINTSDFTTMAEAQKIAELIIDRVFAEPLPEITETLAEERYNEAIEDLKIESREEDDDDC